MYRGPKEKKDYKNIALLIRVINVFFIWNKNLKAFVLGRYELQGSKKTYVSWY